MAKYKLHLGDCLPIMKDMQENSVDFTLTDIPYEKVNRDSNGLRNLDKGTALVTGKGRKQRIVPLKTVVVGLLKEYLYKCPFKSQNVFIDRFGAPITCNAIRKMIERLKNKTGIKLSSHALRHNFATNYCIDSIRKTGNANIAALSALMGHSDIATTEHYQHIALDQMASEAYISHVDKILLK